MTEENFYGEEIDKLDLAKYGLSHLEGRNILTLNKEEMDALLLALGNDDISLNVPIQCTAENVKELLATSECRRCGACCRPNPLNPRSRGVEVFEEELKAIAEALTMPYDDLRQKTTFGHVTAYAFEPTKLGFTRWLPLPCPCYRPDPSSCTAQSARAQVCRVYPIVFTGEMSSIAIRVTCEYGKDIVVAAYKRVHEADPTLEITL